MAEAIVFGITGQRITADEEPDANQEAGTVYIHFRPGSPPVPCQVSHAGVEVDRYVQIHVTGVALGHNVPGYDTKRYGSLDAADIAQDSYGYQIIRILKKILEFRKEEKAMRINVHAGHNVVELHVVAVIHKAAFNQHGRSLRILQHVKAFTVLPSIDST